MSIKTTSAGGVARVVVILVALIFSRRSVRQILHFLGHARGCPKVMIDNFCDINIVPEKVR